MAFDTGQDHDDVMSEINMTPLVDVMLVLLIIFIIAMPLLNHAIKIDLPRADNQPNKITPQTINLSVNKKGEIHWNKVPLSQEALEQQLKLAAQQQPQPEIHLRGDRHVEYEHVVKVMSAVRRAGIQKLGFITMPAGQDKQK